MHFWQRMALPFLFLALAAALIYGRKGIMVTEEEPAVKEKGEIILEEGEKELRIHREGKLIKGDGQPTLIVVDAGHGGYDPGKIGINQALEKDVNLAIAIMLRDYLEAAGAKVIMTRQEDVSLGEDGAENKKVRDLKFRIETIENAKPAIAVSIHQNSYPQEDISGAQVFYYQTSAKGKKLAQAIQERLVHELDPENGRQIKENGSYYLLKKTAVPLVIVECGFLSNWAEAEKLCDKSYQDEVAWTIYLGIADYLEAEAGGNEAY